MNAAIVVAAAGVILAPLRDGWSCPRCPKASSRTARRQDRTPDRLVQAIRRTGLPVEADALMMAWLGSLVFFVLAFSLTFSRLALLAALATLVIPPAALFALRDRGDRLAEAALPDFLEALGRSLRSGASLRTALGEVADSLDVSLSAHIGRVVDDLTTGHSTSDALARWAKRSPLPSTPLIAAALSFGIEAGTGLARTVDSLAGSLRDRAALHLEVRALASQARFSAWVIAALPIGFLLVTAALDPEVVRFLSETGFGRFCLSAGVLLDLAGVLWMRQIAGRSA